MVCRNYRLGLGLFLWFSLVLALTGGAKHKQSSANAQYGNYGESEIVSHMAIFPLGAD